MPLRGVLELPELAFMDSICSFWLVSALTEIGEVDRARALCEKLLSRASPLGLYAEEIDSHSRRHLWNFPQAFSHLALINAVVHLIEENERLTTDGRPPAHSVRGARRVSVDRPLSAATH